MENKYVTLTDLEEVGSKTRQGIKWTFSLQLAQKILFFGSSVILARILCPADYGLAAMAITLDTITWLVLSLGVNSSVMYFQDHLAERCNAAFWMCLISSTFFFIVQFSLAPIVAHFYKAPMLTPIIQASAIGMFIMSFGVIQKTMMSKNLDYKRISILDASTGALQNILYVSFACAGFRVWSFIYPKIIIAIIAVICLWNMTKWRPQFKFYFKYWGEMLSYGKNVLLISIIDYLLSNSTYILIGSMIGSVYLGLYSFAYDKSMLIINNMAAPIIAISFPTFSRLQNHRDKLKNVFFQSIRAISLITFLFGFCQLAVGYEFICGIFGSKWEPAVILFQMIALYSIVRSIILSCNPLMEAVGKPQIVLKWNLVYAPVYIGSIYLGYKLNGLFGIAAMTSCVGIIGSIIYLTIIMKILNWDIREVYSTIKPSLVCSLIAAFMVFITKNLLLSIHISGIFILISAVFVGITVYTLSLSMLFKDTFRFIIENIARLTGNKIYNIFPLNAEKT